MAVADLPPSGASGGGEPRPGGRRRRLLAGLFAGHLLTIWSIAASNVLLGLTVLAAPWAAGPGVPALRRPAVRRLLAATGAYVLWLLASIVASADPMVSLRRLSELFTLCTLLLGFVAIRDLAGARRLVDGVALVALAIAVVGLGQYLVGYGDLDNRIRGPLSHYMTFSGVLLVADALLLARLATHGGWRRAWRWVALAVINVALLGSYTRSAWVGLAAAVLVLLAWRKPRWLLLTPAAAALFFLFAPLPLLHRAASIADPTDPSNYDRICMAQAGLTMIAERPVFGLGPDMVERRYPIYRHPTAPRYTVPHLHNSFLQLAAERGLPALAAYLALMGMSAGVAWRRLRRQGGLAGPRSDLDLGVLLALLAFNVAGLFENNWGDTEVQRLVLFVLALPFVGAGGEGGGSR